MKNTSKIERAALGITVGVIGVVAISGCMMAPVDGDPHGMDDKRMLSLELTGLEALGEGFVYEGWIIVEGAPVSTGRFTIDSEGMLSTDEFSVDVDDADAAEMFVLTIEPAENDPPEPADTHVLAGGFMGDEADLSIGHAAALGDDFSDAAGSYIMNTPTTADTDDDYDQGIWWLEMTDEGPMASLELPELPAGWVYEGWVVGDDGPVSTGRFTAVDAEDDDGAGATSGPDGFPPFPGQDFIDPAMGLIGYVAVISVEPDPDDSAAPFAIKPLIDMEIDDVDLGVSQDMGNASSGNPTGVARFMP